MHIAVNAHIKCEKHVIPNEAKKKTNLKYLADKQTKSIDFYTLNLQLSVKCYVFNGFPIKKKDDSSEAHRLFWESHRGPPKSIKDAYIF